MENTIYVNWQNSVFSNIVKRIKNYTPALRDFEKYYTGIIKKNYYLHGGILGEWKPLTEKYIKRKKKMVEDKKIMPNGLPAIRLEPMRLTDLLRKTVFSKKSVEITANSLIYRIPTKYGMFQHSKRPFLYSEKEEGLREQDKGIFKKIIEKYIVSEVTRNE